MASGNPDAIRVPIESLVAEVFPFTDLDRIVPSRFFPSAGDSALTELLPWIFTRDDRATDERVDRWPKEEYVFRRFFMALMNVPKHKTRVYESVTRLDDEFTFLPSGYWDQRECLHYLVSEVGEYVEREGLCLDRQRFRLWFDMRRFQMKYVVGGRKFGDPPLALGCASLQSKSLPPVSTPVISYTTTSGHHTPRSCLIEKLQVILGQLVTNIKRLGQWGDKSPDQEVFVVGMHGQFFHIMRGFFSAKDISAEWLGIDKNLDHRVFRVDMSKEYDLEVKEEFLEAIRGLIGIFRYFLSGEAKVGAFQMAFS